MSFYTTWSPLNGNSKINSFSVDPKFFLIPKFIWNVVISFYWEEGNNYKMINHNSTAPLSVFYIHMRFQFLHAVLHMFLYNPAEWRTTTMYKGKLSY